MKRHALFVGVNTYDDTSIRDLKYSVSDASVLADRFKSIGYKVRLLADPMSAELKKTVVASVEGLGAGDIFLFFFAGHGFTAQDGSHLLFCRDDIQKLLRVNSAGTRVDALTALTDGGGFHRAFLLDSCRTDCFVGMEHRGGGATRDLDFVAMPTTTGSFYLLRSCDKFQPSIEFDSIGHGLFTQGLLDAMDARDSRLAHCDTSFSMAVGSHMKILQQCNAVDIIQQPSLGECNGQPFSLFDHNFLASASYENQHVQEAMRAEEERRLAAIRAKEEALQREEKRIRDERIRQEAQLAEERNRIQEERKRQDVAHQDSRKQLSSQTFRPSRSSQLPRFATAHDTVKLPRTIKRSSLATHTYGHGSVDAMRAREERARKKACEKEERRIAIMNGLTNLLKGAGLFALLAVIGYLSWQIGKFILNMLPHV